MTSLNQRGSTLLASLLLSAIVGIAAMTLTSLSTLRMNQSRELSQKQNFIFMASSIRAQLLNPLSCSQILRGQPVAATTTTFAPGATADPGITEIALNTTYGSAKGAIRAGWTDSNDLNSQTVRLAFVRLATVLKDLRNVRLDREFSPGVPANFATYRVSLYLQPEFRAGTDSAGHPIWAKANLNLSPKRADGIGRNENSDNYRVDIFANVIGGTIFSCYGEQSTAAMCEMGGGAFDPQEADPIYRCQPDQSCIIQGSGVQNVGTNCPAPFNMPGGSETGTVNGVNRRVCLWCWDGIKSTPEPLVNY